MEPNTGSARKAGEKTSNSSAWLPFKPADMPWDHTRLSWAMALVALHLQVFHIYKGQGVSGHWDLFMVCESTVCGAMQND